MDQHNHAAPPPHARWVPPADGSPDYSRPFTYLFPDPAWLRKVLILGLIFLIPVVGWMVVTGYFVEVARGAPSGQELPLPELDFGRHLSEGAMYFLAVLGFFAVIFLIEICNTQIPIK